MDNAYYIQQIFWGEKFLITHFPLFQFWVVCLSCGFCPALPRKKMDKVSLMNSSEHSRMYMGTSLDIYISWIHGMNLTLFTDLYTTILSSPHDFWAAGSRLGGYWQFLILQSLRDWDCFTENWLRLIENSCFALRKPILFQVLEIREESICQTFSLENPLFFIFFIRAALAIQLLCFLVWMWILLISSICIYFLHICYIPTAWEGKPPPVFNSELIENI